MSDCKHIWKWNEWTGDVCTVCSFSKDEVRIADLEALHLRLELAIGRILIEKDELATPTSAEGGE